MHTQVYILIFKYEAFTLSGQPSQVVLLIRIYACLSMRNSSMLLQPSIHNGLILTRIEFRLFPLRSSLLRESQLISFPLVHKIFQFPKLPPDIQVILIYSIGFPHSEISEYNVSWQLLRAYRAPSASFFGCASQGIHFMLYIN